MHISSSKILYRVLGVAVLVLLTGALLLLCERHLPEKAEYQSYRARYAEVFEHRVNASVIILGGSNSAHGIIPSKLGLQEPVYNFSFNGATCTFVKEFYSQYLKKYYKKPAVVIYALSPNSFTHFWRKIEDDTKYLPQAQNPEERSVESPGLLKRLKISRISESTGIMEDILKAYLTNRQIESGLYSGVNMAKYDDGFVPFENGRAFKVAQIQSLKFEADEVASLYEFLRLLQDEHVRIVLVTTPAPDGQYSGIDISEFHRIINTITSELRVPKLLAEDTSPGFGKDNSYFNDEVHLTERGAVVYSEALGVKLKALIM